MGRYRCEPSEGGPGAGIPDSVLTVEVGAFEVERVEHRGPWPTLPRTLETTALKELGGGVLDEEVEATIARARIRA